MFRRLSAALRASQQANPGATGFATGFVVMSAGDAASQCAAGHSQNIDMQRNLVSASYNGMVSPAFHRWYRLMDWLVPGLTPGRLVPKVLLSQIVTTGLNNPLFLCWCCHLEAWLQHDVQHDMDWAAVRQRTMAQIVREVPNLYGTSMLFWLPVTGANYALIPDHLRILWVSSCSVLWGGFVSHIAHRSRTETER